MDLRGLAFLIAPRVSPESDDGPAKGSVVSRVLHDRALKAPRHRARRTRRPERLRSRGGFRPQVGLLERRPLSAQPTLTALIASNASATYGQSITFTATVSDLSAGEATPDGGTVTFSDQGVAIGSEPLVQGVATLTTSGLGAGTITVTASYGGTSDFAAERHGHDRDLRRRWHRRLRGRQRAGDLRQAPEALGPRPRLFGRPVRRRLRERRIREVVKATGDIITVAGDGVDGYTGDGGPATSAELNDLDSIAVDSAGDLFISDGPNIREVIAATGDITTVAGSGKSGYWG